MSTPPKVFVSHASEDKERFVLKFAERLRSKGIDAWLDRWEMLPGDSLVDKIFQEGIRNAQAIIVILSKNSVNKPWVREELNAGFLKRISGTTRLIPVVIEDCEIPECLKSTLWERVKNIENFDTNVDRIVLAVHGQLERPAIGPNPRFARSTPVKIGSLTDTDTAVFCAICEVALAQDSEWISGPGLAKIPDELELRPEFFCESLEILEGRGYLKLEKVIGGQICAVKIRLAGFVEYLRSTKDDHESLFKTVGAYIGNCANSSIDGSKMPTETKIAPLTVKFIVDFFELKGWVKLSRYMGGGSSCSFIIYQCSPELRRWLRD